MLQVKSIMRLLERLGVKKRKPSAREDFLAEDIYQKKYSPEIEDYNALYESDQANERVAFVAPGR